MKLSKLTFFIAIASMMVFRTSFAGSVTAEKVVSPVAVGGSFAFNIDASQGEDYFSDYDVFIARLTQLTSSTDYSAQLDQFWSELIMTGNFPFAIGTQVAFLYRGSASKINWAGEFNGWNMNADAGKCLGVSDVWILEKEFPADTRYEYKIVRNGSEWLADPHNPHPLVGDFQNSELWMPEYEIPSETIRNPDAPRGTLSDNILKHSSYLGYTCQYRVYTPATYNSLTDLPTIYATDGQNYLNDSMGKMVITLDNLIAEGTIEPVIAVFLDPRDPNNLSNDRRGSEYLYNPKFADYVSKELIPDIDAAYKTNPSADSRAILGASYGACNAAYFGVQLPDYFHLIGMQSPLIHPNEYDVIAALRSSDLEPMKLFLSTGTLNDAELYCNRLKAVFDQKGKEYEYKTIVAGHTWSNWSQLVGDVLTYFYSTKGDVEVALPGDFDGDGQVGLGDFSMFVQYYGLSKGHGDFDVLYDLDGDGRIGLGDFSIFVSNYGRRIGTAKAMPVMAGENGEGALSIDIVDKISGDVNLTVRLEGVRALQGYSFNVRYVPDRFDFRGAERVGTAFSDPGSGLWPLLVVSPTAGEVLVADVLRGDEGIGSGDALVKLRFRYKGSAAHAEFTVTKGMFLDSQGKMHALESGEAVLLLREFALLQAFPNPFNASTVIRIQLPEVSEVRLRVYNLLGQEVRSLMEGKVKAGVHSVLWEGRDSQGRTLATGMYLVRLEVGAFAQLRKIVLVR